MKPKKRKRAPGAGRPKLKEEEKKPRTKVIRVPEERIEDVRKFLSRSKGEDK